MSAADTQLSTALQVLVKGFSPHLTEPDGIHIEQDGVKRLVATLQVMQAMATNLEIEVRCQRDMEAGRKACSFLDEEATDHLSALLPEVTGQIIRPDFGRK